jgi:ribosome maturation factor RimP
MSRNPLHRRLITIIEPVLVAAGFELVDVRFLLEQGGWVLRVQVDRPVASWRDISEVPSERVDLKACEDISHELSAVLDVEDPIPQAYHLEVSSPGIDRPLRTTAHFTHFTGSEAKIQLAIPLMVAPSADNASGARKNFKGTLRGVVGDKVVIECDGTRFELPIADIDHAKLVPDWDAVMHGRSGVGQPVHDFKPKKPGQRPGKPRHD